MRVRNSLLAIVVLVGCFASMVLPAVSGSTWAGKIAYVNRTHIGVKAQSQIRDFLLASDFDNVYASDGTKTSRSKLVVGAFVRVSYSQSVVFGSTRATRIDLGAMSFHLPSASPTQ